MTNNRADRRYFRADECAGAHFRAKPIFGRRLPDEKYNRLIEIITESRRQAHNRLGRRLTDHEADRLEQEARKIRDEEIAYLSRVTSADS